MILAFYRYDAPGATRLDWWINAFSGFGNFSHVEIGFADLTEYRTHPCWRNYQPTTCFSSSPRPENGRSGTRFKQIDLSNPKTWTIVPVLPQGRSEQAVWEFCCRQEGKPYDWLGVSSFVVPALRAIDEPDRRWFCSEVCGDAIGWNDYRRGLRTSPNRLIRQALRRFRESDFPWLERGCRRSN